MKRLLSVAFCFFSSLITMNATPADDVDAAIEKLLSSSNFSWMVTWDDVGATARFRYQGKTEPLGSTIVSLDRHGLRLPRIQGGDAPIRVVFIGERCVVNLDGAWLIPRELGPFGLFPSADGGLIVPGASNSTVSADRRTTKTSVSATTFRTTPGFVYLPRVDLILRILRGQLDDVKSSGGIITAELGHKAAAALFVTKLALPQVDTGSASGGKATGSSTTRSRKPQQGPPTPPEEIFERIASHEGGPSLRPSQQFQSSNGTVTFWVERGMVVKFELRLEATGVLQLGSRREIPYDVLIAARVEDVGTSPVDVPAGAREKLSIP